MRIGMVCPYSFDVPGGVQAHAIDLCGEFIARGHEVSLIVNTRRPPVPPGPAAPARTRSAPPIRTIPRK